MRDDVLSVQRLGGWCVPEKAYHLYDIVTELARAGTVNAVELGVFAGKSLLCAAMALRDAGNLGKIVGIDPYTVAANTEGFDMADPNQRQHVDWWRSVDLQHFAMVCRHEIIIHGLQRCCALRVAMPDDVAAEYAGLHYLHLDDCHSPTASLRNVQVWAPKLAPGGILVVDDVDWQTMRPAMAAIRAIPWLERVSRHESDGMQWEAYRRV